MERQKYPLGKQDFKSLRERGYVYVDKTSFIPLLLNGPDYYFISRPRRFGKSLFLSTLEQFFLGRRELFSGLSVDAYSWDWKEYPVVRLNMGEGDFISRKDGLNERLYEIIEEYERKYNITPYGVSPRARFKNLITALTESSGLPVIILIDEYEKPLLDTLNRPDKIHYRDQLSEFYSVLKNNEDKIRLLFITGVTRFGHLNIFSGFNNLNDISLSPDYDTLFGITDEEMMLFLKPGIERFAVENECDVTETLRQLKLFYDGYHFSKRLKDVYNPFSLLTCLNSSSITSKWFQTGSSRYLLDNLRENDFDFSHLEDIIASEEVLLGVDSSMKNAVTLLYQSGYLTIKGFDQETNRYILGLPNYEVSSSLYSVIIPYYLGARYNSVESESRSFITMLREGKAKLAMQWLQRYFSSIPYDVKLDFESEFQQVIYAFFALTSQMSGATLEKKRSDGRIDMVYETDRFVYIFEFKRGEDAEKAMQQINSKQYPLQWKTDGRKVFKIGIAFSPQKRGIAGFAIE